MYGFGMSHATTASQKLSFRARWRVGDTLVGREMLDGQHQRVDIPAYARTAYKGCLQKRREEDIYLLNHPLCPPDDPLHQGTDLN